MKKLALTLSLLLALSLSGCAKVPTAAETDFFKYDTKTGYTCSAVPFGSSLDEVEDVFGTKLQVLAENPGASVFPYTLYGTEKAVSVADCVGTLETQFDEDGKLFSLTFADLQTDETSDAHFEDVCSRLTKSFGKPIVETNNGVGTQYLEWQDKKSGTALSVSFVEANAGGPSLLITVFEKEKLVENGADEWNAVPFRRDI